MKVIHDFDFVEIKEEKKLSFYQQVKLVNYIRRQIHLGACIFCDENIEKAKHSDEIYKENLLEHMKTESHIKLPDDKSEWDQSQYLFPTYENDTLLSYLPDEGKFRSAMSLCKSIRSTVKNFPYIKAGPIFVDIDEYLSLKLYSRRRFL